MRRGWFGPKPSGYGIGPRTWEGWVATGLFGVALVGGNILLRHSAWGRLPLNHFVVDGALLAAFVAVVSLTYEGEA